jgi:hypothetical protein
MVRTTGRCARRYHRCGCGYWIGPGERYLEHVASPYHDIHSNPHWWRLAECAMCATRYGRAQLLTTPIATANPKDES